MIMILAMEESLSVAHLAEDFMISKPWNGVTPEVQQEGHLSCFWDNLWWWCVPSFTPGSHFTFKTTTIVAHWDLEVLMPFLHAYLGLWICVCLSVPYGSPGWSSPWLSLWIWTTNAPWNHGSQPKGCFRGIQICSPLKTWNTFFCCNIHV